jgi:hypothetical protein
LDIVRGEMVEKDLDRLITKRQDQRRQTEGERLKEALYEPSVSAYIARQEAARQTERTSSATRGGPL